MVEEVLEVGDIFEAAIPTYKPEAMNTLEFKDISPEVEFFYPCYGPLGPFSRLSDFVKDAGLDFLISIGFNPKEFVGRDLEQKLRQISDQDPAIYPLVPVLYNDAQFRGDCSLPTRKMVLEGLQNPPCFFGPNIKVENWKSRFIYAERNRPDWLKNVTYLIGKIKQVNPLSAEIVSITGPNESIYPIFERGDSSVLLDPLLFKPLSFTLEHSAALDFSKYEWFRIEDGLYLDEDTNPSLDRKLDLANGDLSQGLEVWYRGLQGIVENIAEWKAFVSSLPSTEDAVLSSPIIGRRPIDSSQKKMIAHWKQLAVIDYPMPQFINPNAKTDPKLRDANVSRYLSALFFLRSADRVIENWYGSEKNKKVFDDE